MTKFARLMLSANMKKSSRLAILTLTLLVWTMYLTVTSAQTQTITIDSAVQLFKNYLARLQNPNLVLHEVEEYQNNFYASYIEVNSGIFAFQMLIWKPGSFWTGGMMGNGMMSGIVMPEPGPNMMWNTKYGVMGGMMGIYRQLSTNNMTVTPDAAKGIAQQYLDGRFSGTSAGDVDTYYGYYNIDVSSGGKPFGMLSVNGYTGQVWYHSWHGAYIQTVTIPVPDIPSTAIILTAMLTVTGLIIRRPPRFRYESCTENARSL